MTPITLAPSDFAFLWQDCARCWWLKVRGKVPPPRQAMPRVFSVLDGMMKRGSDGQRLDTLGVPGTIVSSGKKVKSAPLHYEDLGVSLSVSGMYDSLVLLDDGTYAVLDFKISAPSPRHRIHYERQLHGYALALERPEGKDPVEITRLMLAVWSPSGDIVALPPSLGEAAPVTGHYEIVEIPLDRTKFDDFLSSVAARAAEKTPPRPYSWCDRCTYQRDVAAAMRSYRTNPGEAAHG